MLILKACRSAAAGLACVLLLNFLASGHAMAAETTGAATPALRQFLAQALATHPALAAAQANIEVADARRSAADRPLYNPELEFDAERSESRTGTLGLAQRLDWSGKRGTRTEVADAERDVARARLLGLRQELGADILAALARWQTSDAVLALARERKTLMQRLLALAERRRGAGDINRVELDLARLASSRAGLQLAEAESDKADAAQALTALVGDRLSDLPTLPDALPPPASMEAGERVSNLPILQALASQIRAAASQVELRSRERRPDPSIALRAGQERTAGQNESVIGFTFSIPLHIRNNYSAEVTAARAALDRARQTYADRLRRARAKLESATSRYRVIHNAWSSWQSGGQPSLSSRAALLERIWQAGEMSTADYLVQINQTLDTRIDALQVQERRWLAWSEWLVASGRIDALLPNGAAD